MLISKEVIDRIVRYASVAPKGNFYSLGDLHDHAGRLLAGKGDSMR